LRNNIYVHLFSPSVQQPNNSLISSEPDINVKMPAAVKPTKNQMRRAKKKAAKKNEVWAC